MTEKPKTEIIPAANATPPVPTEWASIKLPGVEPGAENYGRLLTNLDQLEPEKLSGTLKTLSKVVEQAGLIQGQLLSHIIKNKTYVKLGYKTFEEYVEKEVGLKRRTAYKRAQIFDKLSGDFQIPNAVIEKLGYSKGMEVAIGADPISAKHWVEKALEPDMSVRKLREEIKQIRHPAAKDRNGNDMVELNKMIFQLDDSQYESVKMALQHAMSTNGLKNQGKALDLICLQFNADPVFSDASSSKDAQIEWFLQRMEATYGIKLEVKE